MRVVCSGYLVRYPLGGFSWHHLQYLIGLERLGFEVTYFEHFGWPDSCYDPARGAMTSDPSYGIAYLERVLARYGLERRWSYLAEDGAVYGLARARLEEACRESDLYLNLSNINWIPELELCERRVLIDTDPVFTQTGGHGVGEPFSRYDRLFTFGETLARNGALGDQSAWLPTRQPVVLDEWPVTRASADAPLTTVMNWSPLRDHEHDGRVYGQKDREFEPFFSFPRDAGEPMEIVVSGAPSSVVDRLVEGGWRLADPRRTTRDPWTYQAYLQGSRGEFSVAKHAYVAARSGWFSERSAGYLASGRPVVVQDTGFSAVLPCGNGLLAFTTRDEAAAAIADLRGRFDEHAEAARELAETYFDAAVVLTHLLDRAFDRATPIGAHVPA